MRVYNMESARSGRPVANQFVIVDDNKLVFQSYDSMIIEIDKATSTITFGKDWNYSTTTAKYRNEFLKMYFPSLADGKKLKMLEQIVRGCGGQTEYQIGAFIYTIKFE
jgi:hypothetical protein